MTDETKQPDPMLVEMQEQLDAEWEKQQQELEAVDPEGWVIEWFAKQMVDMEAIDQAAKESHRVKFAAINDDFKTTLSRTIARRSHLKYRYSTLFMAKVDEKIAAQKGSAKSTPTGWGKAGHRTTAARKTVTVQDEAKLMASLLAECPEAIKQSVIQSEFKEAMVAGQVLEGATLVDVPATKKYYVGKTTLE